MNQPASIRHIRKDAIKKLEDETQGMITPPRARSI